MAVAAAPEADRSEEEEDGADPGPEAEPAAIAAQCGRDADPPAATAGEEVDGGREEGQQHGDEHDLDRPAANQPLAEEDVACRALRERDSLLHPVDGVLRRQADRAEMRDVEPRSAPLLDRGSRAAGRRRHRRDAAAHERGLLVGVEGEAEAHELLEPARPRRLAAASVRERGPQCLDEPGSRRAGRVAAEDESGPAATADGVEVDDAEDLRVALSARPRSAQRPARRRPRRRWRERRACPETESRCAAAVGAYDRASSMRAAVPEALSFSPLPAPLSSRCAMTMISRGERPIPASPPRG